MTYPKRAKSEAAGEYCEIFKNTSFIEHLWATASGKFSS